MRDFWAYDWEVYPNFACVTFIHTSTPRNVLDAYIQIDIKYLEVRNKRDRRASILKETHFDQDYLNAIYPDDPICKLQEEYLQYRKAKIKAFSMMVSRKFMIYKDAVDSSKDINELPQLILFFQSHKVLIGYNSINYDSLLNDFVITNGSRFSLDTCKDKNNVHFLQEFKAVSDEVIAISNNKIFGYKYKWLPKRYRRFFEDYDIQKILYLDKTFTGLKSVAINLKWHRLQELTIHFNNYVSRQEAFEIWDYNINDTLITLFLVFNQSEEITLREQISELYEVNVLNDSRSSIGKRLMSNYYSERSGIPIKDFKDLRTHRGVMKLNTIISDKIKFQTPKFQEFLKSIKELNVTPNSDFNKIFSHNGTFYTIAKGGIHSIDDSRKYNNEDGYIYRDADVTSYYPSILILFGIAPEHLIKEIFLELVEFFKNDRVRAKHAGEKLKAEALKIVINRIYGALKDINDYLFDPKATYKTTFNGELSLLMLIEMLEEVSKGKIHVVSANTDGIVCKFIPEYEELYNTICNAWSVITGFELEYTDYERYVRVNVNNYIAVKSGFKAKFESLSESTGKSYIELKDSKELKDLEDKYIKSKGLFISETPFNKGFIHPVVAIALYRFLIYDISYIDTIQNHWKEHELNILDYCISQKVDKKFVVTYMEVVEGEIIKHTTQQYNRVYVTSGEGFIFKKDSEYDPLALDNSGNSIIAKEKCFPLNDFIHRDDYEIKYAFYINKVIEILHFKTKKPKGNHRKVGILERGNDLFTELDEKET